MCILLVGNKADLCAPEGSEDGSGFKKRAVARDEVETWVLEEGLAGYVETSAKEGTGVEEVSSPLPYSLNPGAPRDAQLTNNSRQAFNSLTRTVHRLHQDALATRKGAGSSGAGSSFPLSLGAASKGCC